MRQLELTSEYLEGRPLAGRIEHCNGLKAHLETGASLLSIRDDAVVWKVSLQSSHENPIRQDCRRNNRIRIGFENDDDNSSAKYVKEEMKIGDVVISCCDKSSTDVIGIVVGQYEYRGNNETRLLSRPSRAVALDRQADLSISRN